MKNTWGQEIIPIEQSVGKIIQAMCSDKWHSSIVLDYGDSCSYIYGNNDCSAGAILDVAIEMPNYHKIYQMEFENWKKIHEQIHNRKA